MSDDIADFLRRAAQRRAQQQPPGVPQPAPQVPPQPQRVPPQPRQVLQPLPRQPEILEAEVVEDAEIIDEGEVSGEDVARHVSQHLDTSGFAKRTSALGAEIDRADDLMDMHLHQKFEHKLGQLGVQTSQAADLKMDAPTTVQSGPPAAEALPALDLPGMLRNRQNLRTAVILNEILRPPDHLW